jgi:hypothetical protein
MKKLVVCLSLTFLFLSEGVSAQDGILIGREKSIANKTQTEWAARWWQWAFSFDRARSPITDRTGEMCVSRQAGEVWFLAGTYGTRRTERHCKVPAGKTLFFPLINYMTFRPQGSNESCMGLAKHAATMTDEPSALVLEVDGRRYEGLDAHRLKTPCFSLVEGQAEDAVADGYYVAVRPLTKGTHVLNFGGVLPTMMQAVTYTILVE